MSRARALTRLRLPEGRLLNPASPRLPEHSPWLAAGGCLSVVPDLGGLLGTSCLARYLLPAEQLPQNRTTAFVSRTWPTAS